jgi:hypothetical protein
MCKVRDYFHPIKQKSLAAPLRDPGRKSQLEVVASGIQQKEKCVRASATLFYFRTVHYQSLATP